MEPIGNAYPLALYTPSLKPSILLLFAVRIIKSVPVSDSLRIAMGLYILNFKREEYNFVSCKDFAIKVLPLVGMIGLSLLCDKLKDR